jgi:hypothetical protein
MVISFSRLWKNSSGNRWGTVKSSMKTKEAKYETTESTEECSGKNTNINELFFNKILCALMVKRLRKNQEGF